MITAGQIEEILQLYKKHDWKLRRVLLAEELREKLAKESEKLFENTEIFSSEINAAWFSRPARNNREAWEIRFLGKPPFALLETFGEDDSEEKKEKIRNELQTRIAKFSSEK